MTPKKKRLNKTKAKKINKISRAINKIDPALKNRTFAVEHRIENIKAGVNDVKYIKDGIEKKVRFDQISSLPKTEQASLLNQLSTDRYELRQERALEQLKVKGKISSQFKRSLEKDNPKLLENILETEELLQGNRAEAIRSEFESMDLTTGEDFLEEADSFFQSSMGTPELFDFYRPGEAGGFSELNTFTWNAYKVLRGI